MGNLTFELATKLTHCYLSVLTLGVYDGILGMDWLIQNQASIHCKHGSVTFTNDQGVEAIIHGRNGKPKVKVVKKKCLMQMDQHIFLVKTQKQKKIKENTKNSTFSQIHVGHLKDLGPQPLL